MDLRISKRIINSSISILDALKVMDNIGVKSLLVVDNDKFTGILSIGDIQRAIISNKKLELQIKHIIRNKPKVGNPEISASEAKGLMIMYKMEFLPIISDKKEIVGCFFWEDFFTEKQFNIGKKFNLPIVIMAGGKGTRLKPLTNVIPKPLIPIGEKTIIEEIFNRFSNYGCINFYISVNYKAELIEYYINNLGLPMNISYFKEDRPLGTAGSLYLLKNKIKSTFFVTNCDILIDQDYSEILNYHYEKKNEITIVAALKHYPIPYGTIETGENGKLINLIEKPELTFKINSGMYVLEPHLIEEVPKKSFFHITDLIDIVRQREGRIGVFPVSQNSWKDIGNWNEFMKVSKL